MPPKLTNDKASSRGSLPALTINAGVLLAAFSTALFLAGCGKPEAEYVEITEVEEVPEVDHSGHDHADHDHSAHAGQSHGAGFDYSLPEGWVEKAPSSMVLLSLQTGSPPELLADVSVSAFPGDVGGQAANVNRWRRQVGLGPLDPDSAVALITSKEIAGLEGWQVELTGPAGATATGDPIRMMVSAVAHNGKTWFFKMTGPAPAIEGAVDQYQAFVESVTF